MSDSSLLTLARSQDYEKLEAAWQASLESPSQVAPFRDALKALCETDSLGIALKLGTQSVDAFAGAGRRDDAISLCQTLVKNGALSDGLARKLFELIEAEYSGEDWYSLAIEMSGIDSSNLTNDAFKRFERVRHYTVGNVLYHRAGWGEGVIERFDSTARELEVRFANGRTQEFPLSSALDSLRPLASDDLRAMRLQAAEELERLASEEPAVLIRKAVALYRGTATSTQVKSELSPSIIPQKKWASFWKKAKTAAAHDPWLQIEGSTTRPTFVLRRRPLTLADEAQRSLQHVADVGETIATCRDYLARGLDDDAQRIIVDLARERVEAAIEKQSDSHAHLLDGILFLEEHGSGASLSAAEELKNLLVEGQEPDVASLESGAAEIEGAEGAMLGEEAPTPQSQPQQAGAPAIRLAALDDLATKQSKEHAITLLPKALGASWADSCIQDIVNCPAEVLEPLVNQLHEAKKTATLIDFWDKIAPYPKRHPTLLFQIGRLYAEGVFDGRDSKPDVVTVGRVMMHLARAASDGRKTDPMLARVRSRLTSLLTGRRAMLERCFDGIERDDLAAYLQIAERGGDEFPQEITDATLRAVARLYPELTSKPERPFWEIDDQIWVTADGLARQREEYRVLVDEKIPANSKAIGAAASLGDLSENSEWEAAMEEQRNLTGRAQEMDQDLRRARVLEENEGIDGATVSPGTRFSFTDTDSGETTTYRLLGPWDVTSDDVLNYRAPIAKAFLGKQVGDTGTYETPDGTRSIRIDSIEKVV